VQAKLTDFGESKGKLHGSRYTTQMVGTARWRAPEVFEDEANREKYTKSADVYSFAMLFFEVLTGEIPFAGIGPTMVLQSIRDGVRPPLPHVDYCPGYLSALIEKCWATNPAERPQFPNISQLLLCCKNLILMHACPSPQSFFMHFNVTGKRHFDYPNCSLCGFKNYAGIDGKPSMTGWGLSEDWKFSFGASSLDAKGRIGRKIGIIDGQIIACFGVFGTLPGSDLEDSLLVGLIEGLFMHPHFLDDPKLAIVETYKQIEQTLWEKGNSQHVVARSKACMCVLVGDHLLVANVGDSRAVIGTYGEAITVSTDHRAYQAQVEDPGPVVRYNHWLVGGGSGVPQFEQNVVTEPEIQEVMIEEGVDFLVLGTTGLWSVVSNQDAVTMAEYMPDAEKAANRLVEEAYCVIVRFHHEA
jgi:protein phosphatase 1L